MIIIDYIKVFFAIKDLNTPFGNLMNWVLMISITGLTVISIYVLWLLRHQIVTLIRSLLKLALMLIGIYPKGETR